MSTGNSRDRDKMGLSIQDRSREIDRRIAETRERLEFSRRFLENMVEGEMRTREYMTELVSSLERQIDRLRRERDHFDHNEVTP